MNILKLCWNLFWKKIASCFWKLPETIGKNPDSVLKFETQDSRTSHQKMELRHFETPFCNIQSEFSSIVHSILWSDLFVPVFLKMYRFVKFPFICTILLQHSFWLCENHKCSIETDVSIKFHVCFAKYFAFRILHMIITCFNESWLIFFHEICCLFWSSTTDFCYFSRL